jgi:hypothetical protein
MIDTTKKQVFRILVMLEFDGIPTPDCDDACALVLSLTDECDRLRTEFGADAVWVEEAYGADAEDKA